MMVRQNLAEDCGVWGVRMRVKVSVEREGSQLESASGLAARRLVLRCS